ncbi:MAG: 3D domain-containing protein [Candidatus Kerfeldbacteria bacterium]|nr:3D domain-containing protein [Candidatus Kerfeldbacteria bacterium]
MIKPSLLGGFAITASFMIGVLFWPLSEPSFNQHRPPSATPVAVQPLKTLPALVIKSPRRQFQAVLYAYSSTVAQTDASPTITASGTTVGHQTVATNCLPFGTRLKIPSLFGDRVFVVEDRMAPRHGCHSIDVWQPSTADALRFGKRLAVVQVY